MPTLLSNGQRVVYQTDDLGFYVGETTADPDPQNPGHWLIPSGCVEVKPPRTVSGSSVQWLEYKWKIVKT